MLEFLSGAGKDWVPTIITGLFSIFVLVMTLRSKNRQAATAAARDGEKARRAEVERLREAEIAHDASNAQDLTERFRTLMGGYEYRITDLSNDNTVLKARLKALEKDWDERQSLCNTCSVYHEHVRKRDARPI